MLLQYESKPKRNQVVNRELLGQDIELYPGKFGFCETMYRCLIDCFTSPSENVKDQKTMIVKSRKKTPSLL